MYYFNHRRVRGNKWVSWAVAYILLFMLTSASAQEQTARVTAQQIIGKIQHEIAIPWHNPTVDTFKAGDPETPVTGVAVVMMATLDVLQRAAASGHNLVITHEPTFFNHLDLTGELEQENDPVFAAKRDFIKKHGLVIWRFHDHWHQRNPDGILTGMVQALGWKKYQRTGAPMQFVLPETTLHEFAAGIRSRLGIHVVRVVGDPGLSITKVGLLPGYGGFQPARKMLQSDNVEVLVVGETTEWETVEYVVDAVSEGERKALVVLGHIPSEQAGMEECARWLKSFVREVPIDFIVTAEPFWAPK